MATDFSYGEKQIVSGGPFKPSGKDMPVDARTRVESYADIASIPNPHVGLKITVKVDETNNNKMTDYIVKSLKANSMGVADSAINEVVRYVDYLGVSSSGGGISQEDINTAVNNYLTEHPVAGGATTEQAAQIEANKNGIADIINNKLDGKTFKFLTQAEYDALSESEKNNETIEYHITDATENSHTHTNKEVLDKISENAEGSLLFNGNKITSDSTSGGITNVGYENLSAELQSLFIVIK